MSLRMSTTFVALTLLATFVHAAALASSAETVRVGCEVFDPFRVTPDGHKYQIGGAFPLHSADCRHVRPAGVREIVGVQWALSHWNQRAEAAGSTTPALGLFAGDSCARPRESVAQTLRFMDALGFHEPRECARPEVFGAGRTTRRAKLLGILVPTDAESARAVAGVLRASPRLPVGVYGVAAAEELRVDGSAQNVISTAPLLDDFIGAFVDFVRRLNSNLVAIVDGGETDTRTPIVAESLRRRGIHVGEVIAYDHALLARTLAAADARIIVSLVPRWKLRRTTVIDARLLRANKVWVSVEFDDEDDGESNGGHNSNDRGGSLADDFIGDAALAQTPPLASTEIGLQLVVIRQKLRPLPAFDAYFRRVVANNFASFALLSSFVEQRLNCTTSPNDAGNGRRACAPLLAAGAADASLWGGAGAQRNVHAALRLVYAFALAAERIDSEPERRILCDGTLATTPRCWDAIMDALLSLDYEFGASDPADLRAAGSRLRFRRAASAALGASGRSYLVDAGIALEALIVERHGRESGGASALFEWRPADSATAGEVMALPSALRVARSVCPPYRAGCGNCEHIRRFESDEIFLSNPRQYALYLAGIFDFHAGPNCEILQHGGDGESVALPLAFAHALLPAARRGAPALDFGALLVDGCASERRVMEFLVESENGCYRFQQADRNWTIVSGATFGYISTSAPSLSSGSAGGAWPSVAERFFSSQNSPAPVLTLARASGSGSPTGPAAAASTIFSAMPSHRSAAVVLLKFLRRMRWEFVHVVVDEADPDSVAAHAQFQQAVGRSAAVCVGETLTFDGTRANAPARLPDAATANVTLVFAAARSAAGFLSARLRAGGANGAAAGASMNVPHVHVLVGDAHDFHLHDVSNVARYAGAVSVQPKDVVEPAFREWLASVTPLSLSETWFWRYVEERWRCALSLRNVDLYQGRMCTGDELLNVPRMGRMTKAGYLAKSTRMFVAAAAKVHQRLCASESASEATVDGPLLCEAFLAKGRLQIRNLLAQTQLDDEFEVAEFQPIDHHGNFGYAPLANYSSRTGFHFAGRYRPFVNGLETTATDTMSRCLAPTCPCASSANGARRHSPPTFSAADAADDLEGDAALRVGSLGQRRSPAGANFGPMFDAISVEPADGFVGAWRADAMRYTLLATTTVFCAAAAAVLALVVVKMYFRIVKGNQSLGLTLLVGVLALYGSAYAYIAAPNETVCGARVAAHAIAHTLCFGALLAKALQLRDAETLSAGNGAGRAALSYLDYWLVLLLAVGGQTLLWLRFLLNDSTDSTVIYAVDDLSDNVEAAGRAAAPQWRCSNSTPDFFLAEAYALVLLIVALALNASNRNIKRNYKEAKWLFIASLSCAIVFAGWILAQAVLTPALADYATILELYLSGTALLAFVFGPKIYVLIAYEPIIVECKASAANGSDQKFAGAGALFGTTSRRYDLFEADWPSPPDSRTISPAMSTRATSPTVIPDPQPQPRRHRRRSHASDSGASACGAKAGPISPMSAGALSPASATSTPTSEGSTSDSEALSNVLRTVLRKKTNNNNNKNNSNHNNNDATVRRAASQTARQMERYAAAPLSFAPLHTTVGQPVYGQWTPYEVAAPRFGSFDAAAAAGGASFVVLPHVERAFGAQRPQRGRSASQKSARI